MFHKNTRVDRLISDLAPNEQQLKRNTELAILRQAQEQAEKERQRIERNKKTKIALTTKQKVHAEHLFHNLGGIVSKKEIE